jgi:mono/diheme cytochrome c family protein
MTPASFRLPVLTLAAAFGLAGLNRAAAAPAAASVGFEKDVQPLLEKYCYECHGNGRHKGDVALDVDKDVAAVHTNSKKWETVMERLNSHEMPPEDADALPEPAERELVAGWIEKELFHVDPNNPDPGRVTIHRLNRSEYNNTVRDLVGVDFQPADDFPADNSGYGFDNISDVLSLPPVLMEKYLAAARRILDEAIPTEVQKSKDNKFRANLMEVGFNAEGDRGDGWMPLGSLEEDGLATRMVLSGGDYILRTEAFATPKGKYASSPKPLTEVPINLTIMVDDAIVGVWKVAAPEGKPQTYEMRVGLPPGKHRIAFVNHHLRGGKNELEMRNGRLGPLQGGTIYMKSVEVEGPLPTATHRVLAKQLEVVGDGKFAADGSRVLEHAGEVAMKQTVKTEGEYILRAEAYAQQAGDETAKMEFRVDGKPVQTFEVLAPAKMQAINGQRVFSAVLLNAIPEVYEYKVKLPPGEHRFSAAFINDFADPQNKNPNLRDRNLIIDHLEVASLSDPAQVPSKTAPLQELFAKAAKPAPQTGVKAFFARMTGKTAPVPAADAQARLILADFARRAWRRPVASSEVDDLMQLFTSATGQGESFDSAIKFTLQAVLVSPYFLFRGEATPTAAVVTGTSVLAKPVSEVALASRLSYFLWSSMPDDELLGLAEHGELRRNLDGQVRRMMASPKANALVSNFAGQWLEIRNLKFVAPDKKLFPDFDDELRDDMQKETEMYFDYIMRQDRNVVEFLNGDYTFVNQRLAKHYGLPDVSGDGFQKVSLAGTPRRGVLTQGSVLTITSSPTRTSPVKRGKWVLEALLGTPPPPPPPDVPELKNDGKPLTGSLRQQMEEHRANPTCASCHARMDPIGFGLENFDAIGAYRTKDGDFPVDAGGKLISGESFAAAAELTGIFADKKRDIFIRNICEKMLTYSLGRGIERYDRPAIDKMMQQMTAGGNRFSTLVLAVVKSVPFDMQRSDHAAVASAQ